jgi:hypothetical protein
MALFILVYPCITAKLKPIIVLFSYFFIFEIIFKLVIDQIIFKFINLIAKLIHLLSYTV